jgi:hypothetical protein
MRNVRHIDGITIYEKDSSCYAVVNDATVHKSVGEDTFIFKVWQVRTNKMRPDQVMNFPSEWQAEKYAKLHTS